VVDDDPTICDAVASFFADDGWTVDHRSARRARCVERQADGEGRALALPALRADRAPVLLDDLARTGQAQAGPPELARHVAGAVEAGEDARQVRRR
jgi:hypothetical protein